MVYPCPALEPEGDACTDESLKAREAATDRRADKRAAQMADQRAAMEERMSERKQKESATMDM